MTSVDEGFALIGADGVRKEIVRAVAVEEPVAIEVDGVGYAVLMATPDDLLDLGYGFALAERLIDSADDILMADSHQTDAGTILRLKLSVRCRDRVLDRVRHRTSESSCGLCGIENLEQAMRPLPQVTARCSAGDGALFAALGALGGHQPLNEDTGAVHAAALCSATGEVRLVREDVGRHNAFDKLVGAMVRGGLGWDEGFALLSSRCSFELVEKAALSGCPMLVTLSAPTSLAVSRAKGCGLPLRVLARPDSVLGV